MPNRDRITPSDWEIIPEIEPSHDLQQTAKKENLHPVIVKLMAQRGLHDQHAIDDFLKPKLSDLPRPLEMSGMQEAVVLAGQAVLSGTPILIWGDYDVDGTTGTALLVSFFQELGIKAEYIIPNRISHGYGLHVDLLRTLAPSDSSQKKLLITVDCGISASSEILAAQTMGFQIIVTDHHQPPEGISVADAILNPKQSKCCFPTEELAGVGVAFYLACGIRQHLRERGFFNDQRSEPDVRDYLDLVALGTIADMVPLKRVNRILVKWGMSLIEHHKRPGVKAMLQLTGLADTQNKLIGNISSEDIGFLIAPLINAAGRLAEADLAVQLLLSPDMNQAKPLAQKLMDLNNSRKKIGQDVYSRALEMSTQEPRKNNCLIIKGEFHHGVIGIVASRLVETFSRPVILFGQEQDEQGGMIFKGSGRSVKGINLHAALEKCAETMIRYGGHSMAAGMSVHEEKFAQFSSMINKEIGKQGQSNVPTPRLTVDLEAEMEEVFSSHNQQTEQSFVKSLQLLEPFGPGNRKPIFYSKNAQLVEIQPIGIEGAHLKMSFKANGSVQKGIGFGLGKELAKLQEDTQPVIAYSPMANRYRNTLSWEVRVAGLHFQNEQDNQ